MWAEADKLGFFINTVTEAVVAKEKQVVKNEKRQGVDNQPYGHTSYVLDQSDVSPGVIPYNWQVIGSLADLEGAELGRRGRVSIGNWYGPNNATLVVAGDLDVALTKEPGSRSYFGDIPAVDMPEPPARTAPDVTLTGGQAALPRGQPTRGSRC